MKQKLNHEKYLQICDLKYKRKLHKNCKKQNRNDLELNNTIVNIKRFWMSH